jgi:hypothetical protein
MAVQRWNDQKVANCTCAKAQNEWDKLVIVAKQCPPLSKPILVKLASKQLLQMLVLMLGAWEACLGHEKHASRYNIMDGEG